jgi:hypothetical protein
MAAAFSSSAKALTELAIKVAIPPPKAARLMLLDKLLIAFYEAVNAFLPVNCAAISMTTLLIA